MRHVPWVVAGSAAATVAALVAWVSRPVAAQEAVAPPDAGAPATSWCADGLEAIDSDACFAAPADERLPETLVVYLHGRYDDVGAGEELDRQTRLARLATERGFAVLALHGVRGECNAPGYASHFCWPSNERNEGDGPTFAARVRASIARARERLGPGKDVLLGFSNGGYFAELVATRGLVPFDAVAVAHGGPVGAIDRVPERAPPMLLVTSDDAADPEMRKLDAQLAAARWPHTLVAREGGHSLPDWDLDVVLTFFARELADGFPLDPPLESRSVRDGGAEIAGDGGLDLRRL